MSRFLTPYTYDSTASVCFETVIGDSETIPDQSYTISEIIERFTGGIMPNVMRNVTFDENPDFDSHDPTASPNYDLVDAMEDLERMTREFERRKGEAQESETTKSPENIPDNKEPTVS